MSPLTGLTGYGGGGTGLTFSASAKGPGWLGDRGLWLGGVATVGGRTDAIQYVDITTTGDSSSFGLLTMVRAYNAGFAGEGRGCSCMGEAVSTYVASVDYVTIANTGNASDFGNMTTTRRNHKATSNGIRGLCTGGVNNANSDNAWDIMDYITIATTGAGTDFGDLGTAVKKHGCMANATKAFMIGGDGRPASPRYQSKRQYVTMDTASDSSDLSDLDEARWGMSEGGDENRGLWCGGRRVTAGAYITDIHYFDMETNGSASTFGDITDADAGGQGYTNAQGGTIGNNDRCLWGGGERGSGSPKAQIDYIVVQTTSDASDFGDLGTVVGYSPSGCAGN